MLPRTRNMGLQPCRCSFLAIQEKTLGLWYFELDLRRPAFFVFFTKSVLLSVIQVLWAGNV